MVQLTRQDGKENKPRTIVPEYGNASKWFSHRVDVEVGEKGQDVACTGTDQRPRRLYIPGMRGVLIVVSKAQSHGRRLELATRFLLSAVKDQGRFEEWRRDGHGDGQVHGDVDHPCLPRPPLTPSNGMIHAVLICKSRP